MAQSHGERVRAGRGELNDEDRVGLAGEPLNPKRSIGGWVRRLLAVRLGRLRQYAPRPLRLPGVAPCGETTGLPAIAVVTPSLNQHRFIEQAIQSVVGQGYCDLQYLVQDGGSTDGTVQALQRVDGRNVQIRVEPDRGQAHAINRGFARTDAAVVGRLNAYAMLPAGALHTAGHV